jgi:hypothetical protein
VKTMLIGAGIAAAVGMLARGHQAQRDVFIKG